MGEAATYRNYINGEWIAPSSKDYYQDLNPADETEVIGSFPLSTTDDIDRAVGSAHRAFGHWSRLLHAQREKHIRKFMELLDQDKQRIGEALCREQGKTLKQAMGEPVRSLSECGFILGEGQRMEGITMPSDREGMVSIATRVPLGVVAAIAPWNFPFLTPMRKTIPALVAGNTVVLKPAFDTPMCGVLIGELFDRAGFPPGVVNVVIGKGSTIGDALSGNPLVRGITFTGSTAVGRRINQIASANFTKVQLEMGGKNAAIVAGYKDLDYAGSQITSAAFDVAGQRCTAISRLIVMREQAEDIEAVITQKMRGYVIGNGMDSRVTMGPIINRAAGEAIMGYIQSAREEGATIRAGGNRLTGGVYDRGFFIEPTLVTDVTPSMRVATDEIFGPVLVSIKVDSPEEAVAVANGTQYGLAASVFTDNLEHVYLFQNEIQAGMVHINHGTITDGNMPFGGVKNSGLGSFSKGKTNKDFFTNLKVIYTKYTK